MLKEMIDEVAKANEGFYEAFQSLDIAKMDSVWVKEDYITCIHPGWNIRSGWPEVRDSWVRIFNNTFFMEFRLADIMIQVAGDIAWVLCMENIKNNQEGEGVPQETQVLATNLYERRQGLWQMVHHHGSQVI
jgi:ketosteroid isomerase-like protein